MGAGSQRWWRDEERFFAEAQRWVDDQRLIIARAIAKTPSKDVGKLRRIAEALAKLWVQIRYRV